MEDKIKSTVYYPLDVYKALKLIYAERIREKFNDVIIEALRESPQVKKMLEELEKREGEKND